MKKNYSMRIKGRLLSWEKPLVMGILNTTPDSFFEGSRVTDGLLKSAETMLNEGCSIIDVGGQSTRPGAALISADEELARVIPAIEMISKAFPDAILSIDTFYGRVAREAIQAGAAMINDVSAWSMDSDMLAAVIESKVPYVLMHMQGTPQTMQLQPTYTDVVGEVRRFFSEKIHTLLQEGVSDIILDPGFGFGKTLEHNYAMLDRFSEFSSFGFPLLAGLSRKGMIQKVTQTTAENALPGTIAANTIALMNGATILRVHDVKPAVDAIQVFWELNKIAN